MRIDFLTIHYIIALTIFYRHAYELVENKISGVIIGRVVYMCLHAKFYSRKFVEDYTDTGL